jgi:taurine dioxygenase
MKLIPTSGLIGGEIKGLSLSQPISNESFERLKNFFYERSVITLRDQSIDAKDFLAFGELFGEPDQHFLTHYAHPEQEKILILSNIRKEGKLQGFADAGRVWHSDGSYMQEPIGVTMLYSLEVPIENGQALGDTQFSSAWAAYNDLSASTKKRIDGLKAIHQVGGRRRKIGTGEKSDREQEDAQPEAIHPIARIHPITGRKYIFVSKGECSSVLGMDEEAGVQLINELAEGMQNSNFQYVHRWKVGDILLWDNQAVQHIANHDYEWPKHSRKMFRITIPEKNMFG